MPNRIIREGFLDSDSIHELTDKEECWFHRLMLISDDAGRFDGRPLMVSSRAYPLRTNIRADDVEKTFKKLESVGLIYRYEYNGRPFIQIAKWQKCGKTLNSKYPDPSGSFRIEYETRETRDGDKEFVTTSLLSPHPIRTPYAPHPDGIPDKTNTDTDTNTGTKTKTGTSTGGGPNSNQNPSKAKGSIDEIKAYCVSQGLPESDGEAMFYKWEANGWTNGGKPIKDWRLTIKSWERAGYMPSQKGLSANQGNKQGSQADYLGQSTRRVNNDW